MKEIKYIKYLLFIPFNILKYIFYFLSYFMIRNENIWLFGSWSGKRFSDNTKYLFLHVSNNHKEIIPIWISKDKNIVTLLRQHKYNAYHIYELKAMYYNLRAGYIFLDGYLDSVNFWCSGGARKVQLWHGIPLKKFRYDNPKAYWRGSLLNRLIYLYFAPWHFTKYDYVISTSDPFVDNFVSAFPIKKENVLTTGYPRNDVIFNRVNGANIVDIEMYDKLMKLKSDSNPNLILYMPTFRDDDSSYQGIEDNDFEELNKFLNKTNSYFILKIHPLVKINFRDRYDRIIIPTTNFDVYPILYQMDILITDYSSIYFDFLLADKPIIFFPYDLEKFKKDNREFYFNYDEFTPGPKVFSFNELLNYIEYFLKEEQDKFLSTRTKLKNLTFKYLDGESSERIYKFICKLKENDS